ncbi:carotenoid oxygenase family protein [uncultured Microbacterium sp.]|uniref:carotenoid oxygenase family protein n=1 Tax=uncultured Microbacterium sp. TaxID=191216 RepID=UPI0025F0DE27|nr:carotenoid oxygenase family protein [uncultured Microbacterium sp.]
MARPSPYRRGHFAPVREEVTAFDLPVTGTIPEDLDGRYLRNGPNPLGIEHPRFHYYLGAGMIHGVRLAGGRAEWYRNRWVRQAPVSRALREPRRTYGVLGGMDAASNINVIGYAGKVLSLAEGGTLPFELSNELDTIGPCDFGGGLRGAMSAHPKIDPMTGDLHSIGYFAGSPTADYTVVSATGGVVRSESIDLPHAPMMHDFALTPSYLVIMDLPVLFDVLAALAGDPFPFRWNPRAVARLGLLRRVGAHEQPRWFEIEPVWIYHTVNAHDTSSGVVVDVVTHPSMFRGRASDIGGQGTPSLERFAIDTRTGSVARRLLDDRPQEFPRVDDRVLGRVHRFAYTASAAAFVDAWRPRELDTMADGEFDNVLYKHDLLGGRTQRRSFARDAAVGEAIFVPRRGGTDAEDDGYLLSYVHAPERGASDLVILAADDFEGEELARVHLPSRVPLGLHGNWIPAENTSEAHETEEYSCR